MVFFIGNIWIVLTFLHSQHFQANLTESSCVPLQTKLIFLFYFSNSFYCPLTLFFHVKPSDIFSYILIWIKKSVA